MFLEKLEIQGFKSFAEKTTFVFPGHRGDRYDITAIIGPNGSGKSNCADAVRWVLGEQSLKLLRSKRAEDVIFFGSTKKAQKGFCEVSLYLNNEDRAFPLDFAEVVIARRLYRDGASEYFLNKSKVRLSDIALMLATAHIGQRSYSVVGQGMVDAILQTAASERKEFFDEAVGVRQYQIKRDSAASKLKSTNENIVHATTVLSELEPKMRFFARQLKRLEERGIIEREYIDIQKQYTNVLWNDIVERKGAFAKTADELSGKIAVLAQKQSVLEEEFSKNERATNADEQSPFRILAKKLSELQSERHHVLTRLSVLDSRLQAELVASGKGQLAWLSQKRDELAETLKAIDGDITTLSAEHATLLERERKTSETLVRAAKEEPEQPIELTSLSAELEEIAAFAENALHPAASFDALKSAMDAIGTRIQKLKKMIDTLILSSSSPSRQTDKSNDTIHDELRSIRTLREILAARITLRTNEQEKVTKEHEQVSRELEYLSLSDLSDQHTHALQEKEELINERVRIEESIAKFQTELDSLYDQEKETQRTLLGLQREMTGLGREHDTLRDQLTRAQLEIAKLDAHQEELLVKICDELRVDDASRLELRQETETVYSILGFADESPSLDREQARADIDRLKRKLEQIGTIDTDIVTEHEETKQRYEFLSAQVTDLTEARQSLEQAIEELDTIIQERFEKNLEGISKKFGHYFQQLFDGGTARLIIVRREKNKGEDLEHEEEHEEDETDDADNAIAGIEIEATPPGKKFKSLGFLSGGEKALTSIALLCAILAQNPSPFVILDEVDAALDESNANRFASIIKDLSPQTQFILITHNRVTMHIGHVLYGVTMGEGGVSNMLSLDIRQLDGMLTNV